MAPRWPNIGPTWLQDGPRRPNIGPRWPQDGPTWAQHGPKTAQHGPTLARRSGAGPGPVALPEAFGGNRRLYTLAAPAGDPPPTYLVSIPPHPRPTIIVVIYSVFCVWCSKNIVFYRVSGPSAARNCTLAMLKNVVFSTVFASRAGKNRKKLSLKMFSP